MPNRKIYLAGAHRIAILLFVLFALFPIFWLVKVSVTPNDLLYSEGVRLWPSRMTFDHFSHVLNNSSFPLFFRNSLIVSDRPPSSSRCWHRFPAMRCRGSTSAPNTGSWR